VGQRRASGPVRGTRKSVRRAKRAALIVGAVKARKRATARRRPAATAAMVESPIRTGAKPKKMPRKARIGKR
jgi:hypothetical protein